MMVPRAYRYSTSVSNTSTSEKPRQGLDRDDVRLSWNLSKKVADAQPRPLEAKYDQTRSATKPVAVPNARDRKRAREHNSVPTYNRRSTRSHQTECARDSHDSLALPPAVAALLAVTAIPPRRPSGTARRKTPHSRRMSIDELLHEWRNDGLVNDSLGTSPVLSALLEEVDAGRGQLSAETLEEDQYLHTRSISCDSMPSLEADERSLMSLHSPSTPGSLRSRRSLNNLKKEKARSLPIAEDCASNHPLSASDLANTEDEFENLFLTSSEVRSTENRSRFSFRSNLTSSLQALKAAALNSITSLSRSNASSNLPGTVKSRSVAPFSDDMLWSHPFLFPHFSSEVRPQAHSMPTEAERRYLNPMPLTFEEQEAPFQKALHAPYLAQHDEEDAVTNIPMQTYTRANGRRKSRSSTASEAGRVLLGAAGVRQREPRENSDFLRVVVLEMNMRRRGKIEGGRARIWLPPRETVNPVAMKSGQSNDDDKYNGIYEDTVDGQGWSDRPRQRVIPQRWLGVSAYS